MEVVLEKVKLVFVAGAFMEDKKAFATKSNQAFVANYGVLIVCELEDPILAFFARAQSQFGVFRCRIKSM